MIGSQPCGEGLGKRQAKRLLLSVLLAACWMLPNGGCSLSPGSVRNVPAKIGLRSQESELRAKVEADKFPSAKEAGIY